MFKRSRINLKNILLIFMILQPFLDCSILYSDKIINFVGFSPTTILRFVLLGIIFIYLFFNKFNSKENKYILLYGIVVFVYAIIHNFICINIDDSNLYYTFKYSFMGEIFYLIRLIYPFLLCYIVYLMKLNKKEFKFVIQSTAVIISLILIILNVTLLSSTSYFSNYIEGTIFDWGSNKISRYLLAGKGWFNSANQIGGLILVLFPLIFYYAVNKFKIKDMLVLILLGLSSYSLGTRVSCVGLSLILVILIILFYSFKLIRREKILKNEFWGSFFIISIFIFMFNYAPIVNLSGNNLVSLFQLNNVVSNNPNKQVVILNPDYDGSNVCEFLETTSTNVEYYKTLYPCDDNIEFWTEYVEGHHYKDTNNRLMEKLITKKVYSDVDSLSINFFGMSRSRFESAKIYLERDVVVHFYTLGFIGVFLFIVPYFLICGIIGLKKLFIKKLKFFDICLMSSILLPLLVSILTGHIVDELIVSLYYGFCLGYLLYLNFNSDYKCNDVISHDARKKLLFVVDENRIGGVSTVLTNVVKNLDKKIYKIDILVLHDIDNCLKNLGDDVRIIYGTKFFEVVDFSLKELFKNKKILLILKKVYLIVLMKTCLIKYKVIAERKKILHDNYDVEIAFKDGFTAVFTAYGNSSKKIHWLHYEYKKINANGNYPRLFNKILPKFDNIVAVSKNVMNDFNDVYNLKNKTLVIANLVDTSEIITKSLEKCDRKLSTGKLNIVCVGRLHECKGYDRLINAIAKLPKKEQKLLHVEIYGDGVELDKLKNLIKNNSLNDIIDLKGRVTNPYKYIKNNDLFILCSRFETFGLVIVEAMCLGVPVFALDNSNTSNLIDNKVNGYIVKNNDDDLYNGLLYLIKNRKVIYKYKQNLIDYKYDNQKIINSINKLFN